MATVKKADEYEDDMVNPPADDAGARQPPADDAETDDGESRLDNLEDDVKSMKKGIAALNKSLGTLMKSVDGIAKSMNKADNPPTQDPSDDDNNDSEEDVDKDIGTDDVDPAHDGGDVKLPQAPAGETDSEGSPEADSGKEDFLQKALTDATNALKKVQSGYFNKAGRTPASRTPRVNHSTEIQKMGEPHDPAMEIIKASKQGITQEDLNAMTNEYLNKSLERREAAMRAALR